MKYYGNENGALGIAVAKFIDYNGSDTYFIKFERRTNKIETLAFTSLAIE